MSEDNLEDQYKDFEESVKKENEKQSGDIKDEEPSLEWDKVSKETPEEKSPAEPAPEDNKTSDAGKKVEVPKNKMFDENPDSVDSIMREALTDNPDTVPLTSEDKTSYIKAVLNDKPVILDISLLNSQMKLSIRSRTSWEQTCLYAALKRDQDALLVTDLASVIIQLQKYGCALMLKSINLESFSDLTLKQEDGLEACIEKLVEYKNNKIEHLSMPKWALLLNSLRVFESKLARMGTECLNENFWEPVD